MEPNTIGARLASLKRWKKWLLLHPEWTDEEWQSPTVPCFAACCKEVDGGGPTAAAGFVANLQWCNEALGTEFPLKDYYVQDYASPRQGHEEKPADVLQPWQIWNLYMGATDEGHPCHEHATVELVSMVACIRHRQLARRACGRGHAGRGYGSHALREGLHEEGHDRVNRPGQRRRR